MTQDVTWKHNGSGDWFTAGDWTHHAVPGADDDVTLTSASRHTISYNGSDTIAGLISGDDALAVLGGTLCVLGDTDVAGGLNESGGLISLGGTANTITGGVSISAGVIAVAAGESLFLHGPTTLGGGLGASFIGAGTLVTSGILTIEEDDGSNEAALGGGLVWKNTGTVVDAGIFSADFTPGIALTILNERVFDFTTDTACLMNGYSDDGEASSDFDNVGLLEKTGGTGDTTFYATITSTGTISLESGTLDFEDGGTVGGTIEGPASLEFDGGGTVLNALALDTNIDFGGGTVTLSGVTASGVLADHAAAAQIGHVTLGGADAGTLDVFGVYDIGGNDGIASGGAGGAIFLLGGTLEKSGGAGGVSIAPVVTDDGGIVVEDGLLKLSDGLSGTGGVTIGGGARFQVGAVASGITVTLASGGELVLDNPAAFAGEISSFVSGTTLDLRGLDVTYATASSTGTLTLENGGIVVGTLKLGNDDSGASFSYQSDHHGGTLLEISGGVVGAPARMAFLAAPAAGTSRAAEAMPAARIERQPVADTTAAGAISLSGTYGSGPQLGEHAHTGWLGEGSKHFFF